MIGEDCGRWDGRIFSDHEAAGHWGRSVVGAPATLDW